MAVLLAIIVFADGERVTLGVIAREWQPALAAVAAFHLMTAYFFTTLLLSFLMRAPTIKLQVAVMCAAFVVHFGVLFLISGGWSELLPLLPGGAIIVALSTLVGCAFLQLLATESAAATGSAGLSKALSPTGFNE